MQTNNRRHRVARLVTGAVALAGTAGGGLAVSLASPAPAFAAAGQVGVYQVGLSMNCNKPSNSLTCGDGLGGYWGWADFTDSAADPNDQNAGSGGDGQFEGCDHSGDFHGAGHQAMDIHDWTIAVDPEMGIPVFYASWTEVDTFSDGQGQKVGPYDVTDASTGIPAFTVHATQIKQLFGQPLPPGSSINVQVAWKPAH